LKSVNNPRLTPITDRVCGASDRIRVTRPAGFDLRIRVIFLLEGDFMKIQASFVQDGKWWVAWTDDVPGALTQGATLDEARENLIDAVRMMRQPVDLSKLPKNKIVIEQLEV
jgi:Domain of unknown function (DUF1902)